MKGLRVFLVCLAIGSGLIVLPVEAAKSPFPEVREQDRNLGVLDWEPAAGAAHIYRNAEFWMLGAGLNRYSSSLVVEGRMKVFTEEGKEQAEIEIPHSGYVELRSLEGRTVLPDGRTFELGEDAIFRRTSSEAKKWYVTTAVFPSVEVGAILDYRYELSFNSFYFLEPWYFQDRLPTLYSEIVYHVPKDVGIATWGRETFGRKLTIEKEREALSNTLKVWMDKLPAIPAEAFTVPFGDVSSQFMIVPTQLGATPLMKDWASTCKVLSWVYDEVGAKSRNVRSKAKELTAGAGSDLDRAKALFAYVRDQVETTISTGVVPDGENLGDLLDHKLANPAGKALILHEMLSSLKIDSEMILVADRTDGLVDPSVANPNWFEGIVVRLKLDGRTYHLDPSRRGHPFDYLSWRYEGLPALVYHPRKPEMITMPTRPFSDNRRTAKLSLVVDEDGRLSGTGELLYEGHHANAPRSLSADDPDYWPEDLLEEFPGFDVSEVTAIAGDDGSIRVTWSMTQVDEEVLGDETSVALSRPLGPVNQALPQPSTRRRTPVLFGFGDRDIVEVEISWPEGWSIDVVPDAVSTEGSVGAFAASTTVDEATRSLTYTRRFDITAREFYGAQDYEAVRNLFAAAEAHDAQPLVLVRD